MQKLSVIILTHNDEKSIVNCIESVGDIAAEILVIDDYSTDRTVELVEHLKNPKTEVLKNHLQDDFSLQRNFGLSKASRQWGLFIDSDEIVTKQLRDEILHILLTEDESIDGYLIPRVDNIWGQKIMWGEAGDIRLLRLGRVGKGKWKSRVHEVWDIKGKKGQLSHPIEHFPHQTIEQFLSEINYYTTLRAHELWESKNKTNAVQILFLPVGKFFLNYIIRKGYKDGIPGFIYAILMSLHSFLVRGKLWLLWKKHEQ